jgi:hypothetical protein
MPGRAARTLVRGGDLNLVQAGRKRKEFSQVVSRACRWIDAPFTICYAFVGAGRRLTVRRRGKLGYHRRDARFT